MVIIIWLLVINPHIIITHYKHLNYNENRGVGQPRREREVSDKKVTIFIIMQYAQI